MVLTTAKRKTLSIILAIIALFVCASLINVFFNASSLEFTSLSLSLQSNEMYVTDENIVTSTIGGVGSETVEGKSFSFKIKSKHVKFPNFNENGEYSTTLPSGDVVTYYLSEYDEGYIVTTDIVNQGDTIEFQFKLALDPSTVKTGENINIELSYNDEVIATTNTVVKSSLETTVDKSGVEAVYVESNPYKYIIDDLYYNVDVTLNNMYALDDTIKTIHIEDIMTFPSGMFINYTNDSDLINILGLSGLQNLSISPVVNNGLVSAVTFTYSEDTNNSTSLNYKFDIDESKFVFTDDFVSGSTINNKVNVKGTSLLDTNKDLGSDEVNTSVTTKESTQNISQFYKNVIATNKTSPLFTQGYVVKDDIVLYGIYIQNGSPVAQTITVTDEIPSTLKILSEEDIKNIEFTSDISKYPSAYGTDYQNSNVSKDGNKLQFVLNDVPSGTNVICYVYCKLTENKEQSITNKSQATGATYEASHTMNQKTKSEELEINKTASYNGVTVGTEFTYTITVTNNSSYDIWNYCICDFLPEQVQYVSSNNNEIIAYNNSIIINNVSLKAGESKSYSFNVKIVKESSSFTNTAYLKQNHQVIKQATVENKNTDSVITEGKIELYKTSDTKVAYSGDTIIYKVTITNKKSVDVNATSDPFIVVDEIPEYLDYVSSYYNTNIDGSYKDANVTIDGNTLTWSYNGIIKSNGNVTLYIECKVKDDSIISSGVITNTATLGDLSSSCEIEIVKSNDKLIITKTPLHEDGSEVIDGELYNNEKVKFRIKIENPSDSTRAVGEIRLKDIVTGDLIHFNSTKGILDVKIIESSNVNGFVENETILQRKDMWTAEVKWGGFNFTLTNNINNTSSEVIYSNKDFAINPNGYIVLEYSLQVKDGFVLGNNKVVINDKYEAETGELKLGGENGLLIDKSVDKMYVSSTSLKDAIFEYKIKITNTSEADAKYLNEFIIEDMLPDGMIWEPAWYGAGFPKHSVFYSGLNQNLWSNEQGGQYYLTEEDGFIRVEFGSVKDDKQWLLDFKKDEYFEITLYIKFTDDKIKELEELFKGDVYSYPFKNTATLTSDRKFYNQNNDLVNEISDSETIYVKRNSTHPGINKTAVGSFTNNYNNNLISYDDTKNIISPGDSLVWSITISNPSNNNTGDVMSGYYVTDIIPSDYTYDFTNTKGYPNSLTLIKSDGTKKKLTYFHPQQKSDGSLVWDFTDSKYDLSAGDSLKIEYCLISNGSNKYGVYTNTARLTVLDGFYSDSISSGNIVDETTIESSDTMNIQLIKTSSYKSIQYKRHSYHSKDPINDTGYSNSTHNYIQGMQGEEVFYNLSIKNESTEYLKNFVVIDRTSYVGDIGVVSKQNRYSAFAVPYNRFIGAFIYNEDGSLYKDVTNNIAIMFANNKTNNIHDTAKDWDGISNDVAQWYYTYNADTVLVRFTLDPSISIPPNSTIEIQFTGLIDLDTKEHGQNNIAWNNFAYAYDYAEDGVKMVAEPAKVGVWVEEIVPEGRIEITKHLLTKNEENKIFYFALFIKENDNYVRYSPIKSTQISSGEEKTIDFSGLSCDNIYYIYETDASGNILNDGEYKIINQGTELILDENHFASAKITNTSNYNLGKIVVNKIDNYTGENLSGATFRLTKQVLGVNGEYVNDDTFTPIEVYSNEKGVAIFENIEYGTYKIEEIKAPIGYNLTLETKIIEINADTLDENDEYSTTIDNIKRLTMPLTGGIGIGIFVITGLLLMSISLFIFYKNRHN